MECLSRHSPNIPSHARRNREISLMQSLVFFDTLVLYKILTAQCIKHIVVHAFDNVQNPAQLKQA